VSLCTAATRFVSFPPPDAPSLFNKTKGKPKTECISALLNLGCWVGGSRRLWRREVGEAQPPGVRVRAPKPKASRGREGGHPPAEGA